MATQALATREQPRQITEYDRLRNGLEKRVDAFKMALPQHITPEKFQQTVVTAAQSNPDLLKADRATLITACLKAAQDGLLPDGREAALVVFNTRAKDDQGQWVSVAQVQYMPMVYGLRKKILQSGEISSIETNVVYRREVEEGHFIFEGGTEAMLRHRPMLDLTDEDLADDNIAAAYSVATMKDGTKSFEVMRRAEINKVRQASKTGALGGKYPPKGPWVDWFAEMARKTVMRRHSKTLPMSGDLVDIEAQDEAIAARSASALLGSTSGAEPTALPSREDAAQRLQAEQWLAELRSDFASASNDAERQAVHERNAAIISDMEDRFPDIHEQAMSSIPPYEEVDEDTARDLDRQGFNAMEGRAGEDHGDQHPGDEDTVSDDEAKADALIERLQSAKIVGDVIAVEKEADAADLAPDQTKRVRDAADAARAKLTGK